MADLVHNTQPYNQPMSIWDAYRQGRFGDINSEDEEERKRARNNRNYYMIDAIANFGQKTADNLGRVAAAYGGGSYTPSDTTSLWEQRNRGLTASGIEAEQANTEGSERNVGNIKSGQEIEQKEYQLTPARIFIDAAQKSKDPTIQNLYAVLAAQAAGSNMEMEEYIGSLAAANPEIGQLLNEIVRGGANAAELGATLLEKINNVIDKAEEKLGGKKEPTPDYTKTSAEEDAKKFEEEARKDDEKKATKAKEKDNKTYQNFMKELAKMKFTSKSLADFTNDSLRIKDPELRKKYMNEVMKKFPNLK